MGVLTVLGFVWSVVLGAIMKGWVLSILWDWFVVSTFDSVPPIGVVPAIGLALVVNYLVPTSSSDCEYKNKGTLEVAIKLFVMTILMPLFTLFVAYIVHCFM